MQNEPKADVFSNIICLITLCWHTWENPTLAAKASWNNCYLAGDLCTATYESFIINTYSASSGLWFAITRHLIPSVPRTKPFSSTESSSADLTELIRCLTETETAFGQYHIYMNHLKAQNIHSHCLGLKFSWHHVFMGSCYLRSAHFKSIHTMWFEISNLLRCQSNRIELNCINSYLSVW